ncbi:MAG: sulfotransferase domain-containing protein [Proteobacteria bacterium]|nr:sulfotransferase domain-containing protein [Pseudomonadota bacterium]
MQQSFARTQTQFDTPIHAPAPLATVSAPRPNFFLVGAPKCGTTALAAYLRSHPEIFVSEPKEPNYFARHLTLAPELLDPDSPQLRLESYLDLFRGAEPRHRAIGEASTRYLRSRQALEELRAFAPDARIIVQVRNPVDLAYSWHSQKCYENQEDVADFESAWRLSELRAQGEKLPHGLRVRDALDYRHVAQLGTQLETVLRLFPREHVLVLVHDDLVRDPLAVYERTCAFLGVPLDGRREFPVVNGAKQHRLPALRRWLQVRPDWIEVTLLRLRKRLGVETLGVGRFVDHVTTVSQRRAELPPALRAEMLAHFAPEIDALERLLERDLSPWRRGRRLGPA